MSNNYPGDYLGFQAELRARNRKLKNGWKPFYKRGDFWFLIGFLYVGGLICMFLEKGG